MEGWITGNGMEKPSKSTKRNMERMIKMRKETLERIERMDKANELIKFISSVGRRFFYSKTTRRVGFYHRNSRTGRIYFVDEWNGKHYPLAKPNAHKWHSYPHGSTLKYLVKSIYARFICDNEPICNVLGPADARYCNDDPWRYGDDMKLVRKEAVRLGIYKEEEMKVKTTDGHELSKLESKALIVLIDRANKELEKRHACPNCGEFMLHLDITSSISHLQCGECDGWFGLDELEDQRSSASPRHDKEK
jgi:ribosomal protein S27AE